MIQLSILNFKKKYLVLAAGLLFFSCKEKDKGDGKINFDRPGMLTYWADEIIIPAYANFKTEAEKLQLETDNFSAQPNSNTLHQLHQQFKKSYLAFEEIKAFEFGPAADISFRASLNTYPADTSKIQQNIIAQNVNLGSAANITAKGFPALDYLLFSDTVNITDPDRLNYIKLLTADILHHAQQVNLNWNTYREEFINASGTDLGSSLGQVVNSINMDYELIKNAKIGFPSGKKTLGQVYPEATEAYYSGYSLPLAIANTQAIFDFYRGFNFDKSKNGPSLEDYLQALEAQYNNEPLDEEIVKRFDEAIQALQDIKGPLSIAITNQKKEVDAAYLALQRNVVLLKTDMPSAMGVLITYQDNDGD